MRKVDEWERKEKNVVFSGHYVIASSLPPERLRPNDDRWNAARSRQLLVLAFGWIWKSPQTFVIFYIVPLIRSDSTSLNGIFLNQTPIRTFQGTKLCQSLSKHNSLSFHLFQTKVLFLQCLSLTEFIISPFLATLHNDIPILQLTSDKYYNFHFI